MPFPAAQSIDDGRRSDGGLWVCGLGELLAPPQGATTLMASTGQDLCVSAWDHVTRWGVLLHFIQPSSAVDPVRAASYPAAYADTGMALLWASLLDQHIDPARVRYELCGGSGMPAAGGGLSDGLRNFEAAHALLRGRDLAPAAVHCGGPWRRNLVFDLRSGAVSVTKLLPA